MATSSNGDDASADGPAGKAFDRRSLVAAGAGLAGGAAAGGALFPRQVAAQAAAPAGPATALMVRDFGARGDGRTDDSGAVRAAISAARQSPYQEKRIVFPAGIYSINTIDLTGTRGIVLVAEGTVQLMGRGGTFILGAEARAPNGGDASVYDFRMEGGQFLIAPAPGASYRYGLQLHGFVMSTISAVSVSGEYGAGEYERAAVSIDRSWVNRFVGIAAACPGAARPGGRSVAVRCGEDSVNANIFDGLRITGSHGQPGAAGSVGMVLTGTANRVANCDISAVETGLDLKAARGCTMIGNYHEGVRRIVVMEKGNSCGCTFIGGYYEIGAQATAFSLGSSESTTIMGGYYRGSSGGVFVDRGQACYGLSVIEPMLLNVAVPYKGVERGGAASGTAAARIGAAGVIFPDQAVPSDNPQTLDDYREGHFVASGNGFVFGDGPARYTKIGDMVHLRFRLTFPASSSAAEAALINLPYAGAAAEGAGVQLGDQRNPAGNVLAVRGDRLVVIDPRTGTARTNAEVAGNFYSGVALYRAG